MIIDHHKYSELQVLLIEPSPTQQHIIKNHLHSAGVSDIVCVSKGVEALEQIPKILPELVISSMYLPDMTGEELVHAIRALPESYTMAYLLISSETKIECLEPIRQAGAVAILPKPFTQQQLNFALQATLEYLHPDYIALEHFNTEDLQVLLVDDSDFFLKFLTHLLNDFGIENIIIAHDGADALTKMEDHYFDLIITDYNMPKLDGLQLIHKIRIDQHNSVPILMITSEQNEARLAVIKQAGVSAILDKPFAPTLIRNLIVRLLN